MTQITVDLTGIQDQDTIKYDALNGKFVKGPAALAPKVASDLAGLGSGQANGQLGIVRVGTYPDDHEVRFRWVAGSPGRWVSTGFSVLTTNDAWAVDGINQQYTDFQNAWYRPIHGVGWYHGTRAILNTNYTAGATTLTVKNVSGSFPAVGALMVRGWTPSYTGITDNGDGTLTFTGISGGPTATVFANYTPVIPYDSTNAGDTGGWGLTTTPIDHAGELWTAGFRLQERVVTAYLNGSQDGFAMDVSLFWWQLNYGDTFPVPSPYDPPSGHLGQSLTLTGNTDPKAADRSLERGFDIFHTSWTDWTAGTPTKRILIPYLYHRMPASAKDTGEMYGWTHECRWVGTPA